MPRRRPGSGTQSYAAVLFTTFCGAPSTNAPTLAVTVASKRSRASWVAQAIWGVTMMFWPFACSRGLSGCMGSTDTTSAAKPASLPDRSASTTACSSTSVPRAVFRRYAPSFMRPMVWTFIMRSVSGVAGACRVTTSETASSSSRLTWRTPSLSSWGFADRFSNTTGMPKARAMRHTACPMLPMPTMPIVLPASSTSGVFQNEKSLARVQSPSMTRLECSPTCKHSSSSNANVICATSGVE